MLVATFLLTIVGPLSTPVSSDTVSGDPATWYHNTSGVLTTDTYSLYPYATQSMDVGFSKYGEFINDMNGTASNGFGMGSGLQYPGYDAVGTYDQSLGTSRDPFANELVSKALWVNGWLVNITYRNRIFEGTTVSAFRNIFAFALFSDGFTYGKDWQVVSVPSIGIGGRQTNGAASTDPLKILYDGPREFIAVCTTHINDTATVTGHYTTWPLLDVVLTIIFNKDSKAVIIYKDVKLKLEEKYLEGLVDVQLSNRGEWDLGPASGSNKLKSYADFVQTYGTTVYGEDYTNGFNTSFGEYLLRDTYDVVPEFSVNSVNPPYMLTCPIADENVGNLVNATEHVFIDGVYQLPGVNHDYLIVWNGAYAGIHFNYNMTSTHRLEVYYKNYDQRFDNHISLAQIISADYSSGPGYVGYAAYWPKVADWTVDGWNRRLVSLLQVQESQLNSAPSVPFVTGQWSIALDIGQMYRTVEVMGVTDYHDAKDPQMPGTPSFVADREVKYQLNQILNPMDLNAAVTKKNTRWVEFFYTGSSTTYDLKHTPVVNLLDSQWDQYCLYAERLEKNNVTLQHRYANDPMYGFPKDYSLTVDANGVGHLSGLSTSTWYKILYSTASIWDGDYNDTTPFSFINVSYANGVPWTWDGDLSNDAVTDPLGATWHTTLGALTLTITLNDTGAAPNVSGTFPITQGGDSDYNQFDNFKVFKEQTTTLNIPDMEAYNITGNAEQQTNVTFTIEGATYTISAPSHFGIDQEITDIHVDWFTPKVFLTLTVNSNATSFNATGIWTIETAYQEHVGGRYEEIVVGRDAASVDSAGAAMVSAAFKEKQVEIGFAAEDQYNNFVANQIPWIMRKFGTTGSVPGPNDWLAYLYNPNAGDMRTALKDDWCTTWPVSSANVIGIGGAEPYVNLVTYYFNDYTAALSDFPGFFTAPYGSPFAYSIAAVSCWNKNTYATTNNTVGYAVVAVSKDFNSTIGLSIYGHWGRDTWAACKWFLDDGVYEFETFPQGVTSIILQISYTSSADGYKPTGYKVVETLGTISEHIQWKDMTVPSTGPMSQWKGGLHPDP